jgi:hypothetical protein
MIQFAYPMDSVSDNRYLKMVVIEVNWNCSSFNYDGSAHKVISTPCA